MNPAASDCAFRLRFRAKQQLTVLELRCRQLSEPLLLQNSPGKQSQIMCQSVGTIEDLQSSVLMQG